MGDDAILALDSSATSCWFAGRTNSPDLRVEMPLQAQLAGQTDAFLVRLNASATPFSVDVNGRVIGFTIAAALITVGLFGFLPAFRTTNLQLSTALKVSAARRSRRGR